jgi:uncharacterized membrane protein YedE/YeeE
LAITEFTPWASLAGGALIGAAAVLLMLLHGRIAGISGILGRLLPPYGGRAAVDDVALLVGLISAPIAYRVITGADITQTVSQNLALMVGAGLLVGVGTALGRGCTSGHGVCGLARLSPRSAVATAVFMATAFVTVLLVRHGVGS